MGMPVVTVASGGLPVVDNTAAALKSGTPVTESTGTVKYGVAVTKVASGGMPVVYETIGVSVPTATIWNTADLTAVNLTNGSLTETATAIASGVRGVGSITSGKYYCEYKISNIIANALSVGFCLASTSLVTANPLGAAVMNRLGAIFVNNVNSGVSLGTRANNDIIGVAIDVTGKLIWFRVAPAGTWNASGTADPATGAGGINITSIATGDLFPCAINGGSGDSITANFGASAFSGAVPSGYTAGILV